MDKPQDFTAAELATREYQEAVIGLLMQAGIIRDDGSLDEGSICVSAYEHAVSILERDGFIATERVGFWKKSRRVFSFDRWRALRDRIAALDAAFNTADRSAKLGVTIRVR